MALSPDGAHFYITDSPRDPTVHGSLWVVDASSGVVGSEIQVGEGESRVAVSPDGSSIYVSTAQDDKVSVIDAQRGAVVQTIGLGVNDTTGNVSGVGLNATGLVTSPDGSLLYVSEYAADRVAVIDTRSHSVARNITVGEAPVAVAASADGSRVYALNQAGINGIGSVSVVDTGSSAVIQTINVGRGPVAFALSPAGAQLAVLNSGDLTISVIDVGSGAVSRTIQLSDEAGGIAVAVGRVSDLHDSREHRGDGDHRHPRLDDLAVSRGTDSRTGRGLDRRVGALRAARRRGSGAVPNRVNVACSVGRCHVVASTSPESRPRPAGASRGRAGRRVMRQ